MQWFGLPFHPSCEQKDRIRTPVGDRCDWCDEVFTANDSGARVGAMFELKNSVSGRWMQLVTESPQTVHSECLFRMMWGSRGHMEGECECHGINDTSEVGLTPREAALAAWEYARRHEKKETIN